MNLHREESGEMPSVPIRDIFRALHKHAQQLHKMTTTMNPDSLDDMLQQIVSAAIDGLDADGLCSSLSTQPRPIANRRRSRSSTSADLAMSGRVEWKPVFAKPMCRQEFESAHPYPSQCDTYIPISFPGAPYIRVKDYTCLRCTCTQLEIGLC